MNSKKHGFSGTSGVALMFIAVALLAGCMSYRGQYDASVPLSEQATLKISGVLTATAIDGKPLGWGKVTGARFGGFLYTNFPAGEHTFTFDYLSISESSYGGYTTTSTSSARGMTASVDMKPGYTYRAEYRRYEGNNIGVEIVEEKAGEPKDTFSAPELQLMLMKAGAKLSLNDEYDGVPFEIGQGLRVGQVFDGKTKQGWHIDLGYNMSVDFSALSSSTDSDTDSSKTTSITLGGFAGAAYEYYIPKTNIGFSIGGALNYATDFESSILYPNLRFEFIPLRPSSKFGIYADYNFSNSIQIMQPEEGKREGAFTKTDTIGLGLFFAD
ncbi:MAG: hypothetical protein LBK61_03250 [Spirochaetaceae bacterium]|nr:hypothetical protein [Spirochaetaceae bacterium]